MKTQVFLIMILWLLATAAKWEPIREADLTLRHPKVDPDADAEAIFWKVWVTDRMLNDEIPQTVQEQYVRIKIFTDRGVEKQSTIDLFSASGNILMQDLRARTIKPDGRVIDLEKKAIFERTELKADGVRVKFKSFSMAGVEPGDIVEYQWKQYRDEDFSQYSRFFLQRYIPSWEVTYYIKPSELASRARYTMWMQLFHAAGGEMQEMPGNIYSVSKSRAPPFGSGARYRRGLPPLPALR